MKRALVFQHMNYDHPGRFLDFFAEDHIVPEMVRLWHPLEWLTHASEEGAVWLILPLDDTQAAPPAAFAFERGAFRSLALIPQADGPRLTS